MVEHKIATGFIKWFLKKNNKVAITTLWDTIYYVDEKTYYNYTIYKHEMIHIAQIEEEGRLTFIIKYLWYMVTVGYDKNPYEIEAYAKQSL